jgi:hypothetical protein
MAASRAHVVRELQLTAVGAFLECCGLQRMMAATHVPLRRRGFSLGDSHCGTFKKDQTTIKMATICASSQRVYPKGGGRIVANSGPYSEKAACCKGARAMKVRSKGGQSQ